MFKEFQWLCYDYRYQENVITKMWLHVTTNLTNERLTIMWQNMTYLYPRVEKNDFFVTKYWLLTLHLKCGKNAITSGSLIFYD